MKVLMEENNTERVNDQFATQNIKKEDRICLNDLSSTLSDLNKKLN